MCLQKRRTTYASPPSNPFNQFNHTYDLQVYDYNKYTLTIVSQKCETNPLILNSHVKSPKNHLNNSKLKCITQTCTSKKVFVIITLHYYINYVDIFKLYSNINLIIPTTFRKKSTIDHSPHLFKTITNISTIAILQYHIPNDFQTHYIQNIFYNFPPFRIFQ